MVFSSAIFIFGYLPLVFLGYALIPKRFLILFFFIVNLLFYGWGEPVYLFLMLFSIALNYCAALLIARFPTRKKRLLACCVAVNVLLLIWFKYTGLFAETLTHAIPSTAAALGLFSAPKLPIGISFYTFQAMAYVIDVYRGEIKAERGFMKFGVFIALFPQLIAGPIARFSDVSARLEAGMSRDVRAAEIDRGVKVFICGLSKKLLLANPTGQLWETLSRTTGQNGVAGAWLGLVTYAFHIYFDFSGYSDMAVGLGRILGIRFPENFNYPYISKSVTDFWRRWHITLSSWFRDYVYIPLGGNRKGLKRSVANLFIVWFLTGLWHGAAWNFALWGLYFAVILTIEKAFLLPAFDKIKLPGFARRVYSIVLILIGWRLFTLNDMSQAAACFGELFRARGGGALAADAGASVLQAGALAAPTGASVLQAGALAAPAVSAGLSAADGGRLILGGAFTYDSYRYALAYLPLLIICALASTPLPKRAWAALFWKGRDGPPPASDGAGVTLLESAGALILFLLCVSAVTAQSYNPFIYFRF